MKSIFMGVAIASISMLCACSDDANTSLTEAICPSKINMVIPDELQKFIYQDTQGNDVLPMLKGQQYTMGVTLSPDSATFKDVVWSSTEPYVASVENGVITALSSEGLGYSVIKVLPEGMTEASGVYGALKVTVDDELTPATAVNLTGATDAIYEGEKLALQFAIEPENTTYHTLAWTSSDESVATVDSKGVVTAVKVKAGQIKTPVTITGTAVDGSGVQGSYSMLVQTIVPPTQITIDQTYSSDNYTCAHNEQGLTLAYTTVPAECTTSQITWSSSDNTIATVSDGSVTFVGYGDVTITASCPNGNSSSIKLSIPKGLLRETYHNENHYSFYVAAQSGNGTSTSTKWHDGYITTTTYKVNATTERGDMKWWDTPAVLHAGNYPIIAIKVDDVKDLYKADGVTARNLNFDCVGTSESGTTFKALGNGNNKYSGDLKCSDGSHVFIYDMSTLAFGTGGIAPTNEAISFSTFQIKYADMKTIDHQITYNIYWFQTFKSVADVKKYVTDVDKLTFEVIK